MNLINQTKFNLNKTEASMGGKAFNEKYVIQRVNKEDFGLCIRCKNESRG